MREAVRLGIPVIVGAQVGETALHCLWPRAAGEQCLAQEGAYGTYLLESDMFRPSLMFGRNGILALKGSGLGATGFGIEPLQDVDHLVSL